MHALCVAALTLGAIQGNKTVLFKNVLSLICIMAVAKPMVPDGGWL